MLVDLCFYVEVHSEVSDGKKTEKALIYTIAIHGSVLDSLAWDAKPQHYAFLIQAKLL